MNYTPQEVMQFIEEEDVKFIRLTFTDVLGNPKNIAIMPQELERAFRYGIAIDASAIAGFGDETHSDLFLHPDSQTISVLPWRPETGRVVRMLCSISLPDGSPFPMDTRNILKQAIADAKAEGVRFAFGSELEFYLFRLDENGAPTYTPYDQAGYMDVAPEDKGENVRREICLTLESMGILPERSHHEEGPGQNEIDFRYADALAAADNAIHFQSVVKAVAQGNGLYADFSPKPIPGESGNGMHINISVKARDGRDVAPGFMAGILTHIREITAYLNPTEDSYRRLGEKKAPRYITWSPENRSQLIRIPAAQGEYRRMELRSPDPTANPYLAYALLIYAGLDGIQKGMTPPPPTNLDLYAADSLVLDRLETLPATLAQARKAAAESPFVQSVLPEMMQF